MSEIHAEFDLREQLARIDREMAQYHKLQAETRKLDDERYINSDRLIAEREKFYAERRKLDAEALKFNRDRWLTLTTVISAGIGSLIGSASLVYRLLH